MSNRNILPSFIKKSDSSILQLQFMRLAVIFLIFSGSIQDLLSQSNEEWVFRNDSIIHGFSSNVVATPNGVLISETLEYKVPGWDLNYFTKTGQLIARKRLQMPVYYLPQPRIVFLDGHFIIFVSYVDTANGNENPNKHLFIKLDTCLEPVFFKVNTLNALNDTFNGASNYLLPKGIIKFGTGYLTILDNITWEKNLIVEFDSSFNFKKGLVVDCGLASYIYTENNIIYFGGDYYHVSGTTGYLKPFFAECDWESNTVVHSGIKIKDTTFYGSLISKRYNSNQYYLNYEVKSSINNRMIYKHGALKMLDSIHAELSIFSDTNSAFNNFCRPVMQWDNGGVVIVETTTSDSNIEFGTSSVRKFSPLGKLQKSINILGNGSENELNKRVTIGFSRDYDQFDTSVIIGGVIIYDHPIYGELQYPFHLGLDTNLFPIKRVIDTTKLFCGYKYDIQPIHLPVPDTASISFKNFIRASTTYIDVEIVKYNYMDNKYLKLKPKNKIISQYYLVRNFEKYIRVENHNNVICHGRLFDMLGRELPLLINNEVIIYKEQLKPGIYIVQLKNDARSTFRIFIEH